MSTPTTDSQMPALIEAVIISGPRKGEFITVPEGEPEIPPAAEAMLEMLLSDANQLAESARKASAEATELLRALQQAEKENESAG